MSIYRTSGKRDSAYYGNDPLDFTRGKRHGTFYITTLELSTGHNNVVAQNFESHSEATKWGNANIHPYPFKVWQVASADDGPKRAQKRAHREKP